MKLGWGGGGGVTKMVVVQAYMGFCLFILWLAVCSVLSVKRGSCIMTCGQLFCFPAFFLFFYFLCLQVGVIGELN